MDFRATNRALSGYAESTRLFPLILMNSKEKSEAIFGKKLETFLFELYTHLAYYYSHVRDNIHTPESTGYTESTRITGTFREL